MIKYLNESELNEAYLSVISYGSAVLKHYENWQVEQIRNHAEIELIKLKGTKSENQKHLINESQHVIETIDSFKRSNLFEAAQNKCTDENLYPYDTCPDSVGASVTLPIYCLYLLFMNILLINLIIAIFK